MLAKCPKCELNYMDAKEKMCKVCYREIHGTDAPDEPELCSICNEAPCMPGKDVCLFCHKEMLANVELSDEDEPVLTSGETVSTMDEIAPDIEDNDIPEPEYRDIDKDLSLEELEEKEDQDDDEDDDDE